VALTRIIALVTKNDPTERNHQNCEIPQNKYGLRSYSEKLKKERSQEHWVNQAATQERKISDGLLMQKGAPVFAKRRNQCDLRAKIPTHGTYQPSEIPDGQKKETGDI
jgi:hypothetical protein